jgi:hypothetical protein
VNWCKASAYCAAKHLTKLVNQTVHFLNSSTVKYSVRLINVFKNIDNRENIHPCYFIVAYGYMNIPEVEVTKSVQHMLESTEIA